MDILPKGKITGAFPVAGPLAYQGLVHKVMVAPDPSTTGYVSILKGGVVIRPFNLSAPNGSNDEVFFMGLDEGNALDPTQFSIAQTVAGEGAFVTYLLK